MSKKINLAFIGNGKSTNRYHIPYLKTLENQFNIKKIWQRTDRTKEWGKVEGAEYTNDINDILEDESIDVIVITTPPQTHYKFAKKALEAGKNVIVEKPFTLDKKEAEELFELAENNQLLIQSYQNRRFDSDFLTVIKVIESGILGKIYEIESNYDYYRPEIPESFKIFKKEETFLFTHACHTLDQIISYFGTPEDVKFDIRSILGPKKMNDYFDIDLYYKDLKVSVRSSYFRFKSRPRFIVYGTKGVFIKETEDQQERDLKKFYMPSNPDFGLDSPEQYGILSYIDNEGNYHEERIPSERGDYAKYYEALYNTLMNEAPPLVNKEQVISQLDIIETGLENFEK